MKSISLVFLTLCALLAGAPDAAAQILRLKTGKFLIGSVENANEDGLRFRRLDTGGVLDLTWRDLNAADAKAVRKRFSLLGNETGEDVLIPAVKLKFAKGSGLVREFVGELVTRNRMRFVLRRKGLQVTVAVSELRAPPENVQIPILEILTPDDVYQRKLAEIEPAEDANKNLALAVYLMRVQDYKRAKLHLDKAKELGGGDQPREVEAQLARVVSLLKHKEEADLIDEINTLRNRKHFDKGLELVAAFEQRFPDSKLANEFERRKQQLLKDRETWLVRQVTAAWYRVLRDEAGRIGRTELDFDAARTKAEEELGVRIRERIARTKKIPVEDVARYFGLREERRVAKIQMATYSTGSWILGRQKIIKDTVAAKGEKQNEGKKKGNAKRDKLREELRKRMQEWLRKANKGRGRGGPQGGPQLQTEDQWWKDATSTTRMLWIMAFYAENSGDMHVVSAGVTRCTNCGGKGTIAVIGASGGNVVQQTCPLCHKVQYVRGVRFR